MFDRLEYIRHRPARVLDAGCGVGRGMNLLRRRYADAVLVGTDFAASATKRSKRSLGPLGRARQLLGGPPRFHLCADFLSLPLRAGCVDVVWSNLALAWAEDQMAALREFHRVLAIGGLLMFSSYGPDTLKELKAAFSAVSSARHVHAFADMHDLGDMLVACGFADPVMDVELLTLTYSDVGSLVRDLKASGETCAARDRPAGLFGRNAWRKMLEAYERERNPDGRIPATIEVIYGHAWKSKPRALADGRQIIRWEAQATR